MTPGPSDLAAVFRGELLYGDAWRDHDFTGRRVAIIARGGDAVGLLPEVARTAHRVKVFLDDPDWVLPVMSRRVGVAVRAASYLPGGGGSARRLVARAHLRLAVEDPWLRRLLTPDDRFAAHGVERGEDYYAVLQREHCKLIRWPVYAVTVDGVRTAEGIEHQVDSILVPAPHRLRRTPVPLRPTDAPRSRRDHTA